MRIALVLVALVSIAFCGCDRSDTTTPVVPKTNNTPDVVTPERSNVSHTHTHADGTECTCEDGPNKGHIFKFDNENYKGEWVVSNDNDVVRFHLLNSMDENTTLKVDSFKVTSVAGSDAATFDLEPESPDADGAANTFVADDKDLRIALRMGVAVEVKSGDLVLKGNVEGHEPHDH